MKHLIYLQIFENERCNFSVKEKALFGAPENNKTLEKNYIYYQ